MRELYAVTVWVSPHLWFKRLVMSAPPGTRIHRRVSYALGRHGYEIA